MMWNHVCDVGWCAASQGAHVWSNPYCSQAESRQWEAWRYGWLGFWKEVELGRVDPPDESEMEKPR